MRESIASIFEVASISTTREALPGIEKDTVSAGRFCEGANFTGNSGTSAIPAKEMHKNTKIMLNDDILG